MGLEWHDGESMMTEISFLNEPSLKYTDFQNVQGLRIENYWSKEL